MTRHWFGAAVLVLAATACNGDDDDAVETSVSDTTAPETVAPTTEAPATTEATTTTTEAPTTTLSAEEAIKAQIAADYLSVEQALEDLGRNPTLEELDAKVAAIAVPGSALHSEIVASIEESIAMGERIAPGDPDYSDVIVEAIELVDGPTSGLAEVTACVVTNEVRVTDSGQPLTESRLLAARIRQFVQATPAGWLLASLRTRVNIEEGVTSCGS